MKNCSTRMFGGKLSRAGRRGNEFFVVAEYALDEGFEEAPLQAVAQWRAAQGQRGVDRQRRSGSSRTRA
jgi:hypothetical protein